MNIPKELLYTKSHEWILFENDTTAKIGLTDFAAEALGDLVFANLPQTGDTVSMREPFGDVESVKAVSDVYSPVSGEITAVNEDLLDSPESINSAPYASWLIEVSNITEREELLDAASYVMLCREEE